MFMGFSSDLPWAECDSDFAGPNCYTVDQDKDCVQGQVYYQLHCMDGAEFCKINGFTYDPEKEGSCQPYVYNINSTEGYVSPQ